MTRSVLRLVTEVNTDDERADAGCRRTTRDNNMTLHLLGGAMVRESDFSVVTRKGVERCLCMWRRDDGEQDGFVLRSPEIGFVHTWVSRSDDVWMKNAVSTVD